MRFATFDLRRFAAATVKVHASFPIAMLAFAGLLWAGPARSDPAVLAACLAAVLLSLLVHELAHAVVARRYGIPVARVDVYAGCSCRCSNRTWSRTDDEVIQDGYHPLGVTGKALAVAMYVNLGLALINLLPASIFDAGWMTYAQLGRRVGRRGASVIIALVMTAQAATALALLGTVLIVGIPGSFAIS